MSEIEQNLPSMSNKPHWNLAESRSPNKKKKLDRYVEFERLEPHDLQSVPLVVQALDNHWMPYELLRKMKKQGQLTDNVEKRRKKYVRAEYIRALINGRQTLINRAYIYNNQAVFQDYLHKGESRESFKFLLQEGVVVPYLYNENSPFQAAVYDNAPHGFETWQKICQEVCMKCVRLSWDDNENKLYTRQHLSQRFHSFAQSAYAGDLDTYIQDLRLDHSAKTGLHNRLRDIARVCLDLTEHENKDHVTRNDLYKAFVTVGDNPQERKYDVSKPFALEIKQLIDLAYNSYLPDALGGYLLTPFDSLPRTSLQEWQQASKRVEINGEDIVKLLQQTVFDFVQRGLYLKSMDIISLHDVREVRNMDEWLNYIEGVEDLLKNPFHFADGGAARVYHDYEKLMFKITDLIERRNRYGKEKLVAEWTPTIEFVINVAGATLTFLWTHGGPVFQFSGTVSTLMTARAAPVVARLAIKQMIKVRNHANLTTNIDFMKCSMQDARKQWAELSHQLKTMPGLLELPGSVQKDLVVDANLNYQEQEY